MVGFDEIERIAARKQWVAIKCELSRRSIEGSFQKLRQPAGWIQGGLHLIRSAGPLFILVAPVAKFFWKRRTAERAPNGWDRLKKATTALKKRTAKLLPR